MLERTSEIKWFRVEGNYPERVEPLAQISGYGGDKEWYCLKQSWKDTVTGVEEWRYIEVIL